MKFEKMFFFSFRKDIVIMGCCDGSLEIASISRNKLIGIYTQSTYGISHILCRDSNVAVVRLDGSVEFLEVHYDNSTDVVVEKFRNCIWNKINSDSSATDRTEKIGPSPSEACLPSNDVERSINNFFFR